MNCSSGQKEKVELLDLPNEILLAIINKVKPQALQLCSLINVGNDRLEQLVLDKCDSIDISFDYGQSPYGLRHLLHVSAAVKALDGKILPNLKHLKITAGRRQSYTGTPFTISFYDNTKLHRLPLFSTVPQSVYIEGKLINPVLSVLRSSPLMRPINSFEFDHYAALYVPVDTGNFFAQSFDLTHVSITLRVLPDCVRLLNQLGSQIQSFSVSMIHVCHDNEDIISGIESISCSNLKQLKITIYRNVWNYREGILPLLQHLSNVEHLTLLLAIGDTEPNYFIDGFHLEKKIISYMPHLRQFDFHIRSILRDAPHIQLDTIRQTFIRLPQSVDCTLDYFNNQYGQCQIYSLPFVGNRLDFISNRFPLFDIKNTFINVTMLLLFDHIKPFEKVFFERLTYALPRLKTLEVSNQLEQEEKTKTTNPIEFPHLTTLILHKIHMNYGEQLLCQARLPNLVELIIRRNVLLPIIKQNNQQARNNCSNVETLFVVEPWGQLKRVHLKFFPKLYIKHN